MFENSLCIESVLWGLNSQSSIPVTHFQQLNDFLRLLGSILVAIEFLITSRNQNGKYIR